MRAPNRAISVRPATTADIGRLCEFADAFLVKMQSKATAKDARQVYQHILKHPDAGIIIVAEHKSGICGYCYTSYEWRSEFAGEAMHCVELFVEESWRRKGVAAALLTSLIDTAKRRGIRRISADVHPGNSTIERLLESMGFDPEHRTMWSLPL